MVDQGRVSGILDWEFAAWSDPYEDLGWLCAKSWRFGANDKQVGGMGHKADLFQAYSDASGRAVDGNAVLYWEVMGMRSEEHTSELQSLMRISYAVFCLKKKK